MQRLLLLALSLSPIVLGQTGSPAEPLRVVSSGIDMSVHDGRLRPAIGVENIQVMRANRSLPDAVSGFGWTYNHAPMLAYWNGRFYLQYLTNPFGEHQAPGQTVVMTSADGRTWSPPEVVFPIYFLERAEMAMMHQRMGFYVAPNGRLLVLAFYGHAPDPFGKGGIGRVVREAYKDGTYGPIHFIRYNTHAGWNESNTRYPLYSKSADKGFVEACDALLSNKLMTMQWWEEDRSTDGFYTVTGLQAGMTFHRKDGTAVALWKAGWVALSSDEGKSWSKPVKAPGVITNGAKSWGQKTDDGRYAMVYNPANDGTHRWPLAVVTSDDGITFDQMLAVHGEVAPRRYMGRSKDFGSQYVRGILEGNGDPPGTEMWLTYSGNKEDMWVSRVPVPIRYKVEGEVNDSFDALEAGGKIQEWNVYRPQWAQVQVAAFPSAWNKSLQLADKDPYDYAKAVRVFAEAKQARVSFKLHAKHAAGRLEVELLDAGGRRPVRIVLGEGGHALKPGVWRQVEILADAGTGRYSVLVDGKPLVSDATFAEPVSTLERLSFRTGEYRTLPDRASDRYAGGDVENPGATAPEAVFYVDEVRVK